MAKKSAKTIKDKTVNAALSLAAEQGWQHVSLNDIARKSGLALQEIFEHFEDRFDILAVYGRRIDHQVMQDAALEDPDLSPRDKLFDLTMARFDVLNQNRDGVIAILRSFRRDPKQAVISLPHLGRSMSWMLEAAGISTAGIRGAVKIAGLKVIYCKTLWTWMKDDSPDMAKTMAALDKNLGRAEQWAGTLGL